MRHVVGGKKLCKEKERLAGSNRGRKQGSVRPESRGRYGTSRRPVAARRQPRISSASPEHLLTSSAVETILEEERSRLGTLVAEHILVHHQPDMTLTPGMLSNSRRPQF